MAEKAFGLTATGIRRTAETNRRVLQSLPATGRRTRRVYPPGGGGASGTIIEFQISKADCLTKTATATVVARTCDAKSPDLGEEITLLDDAGCKLVGVNSTFAGRRGFAQQMEVLGSHPYDYDKCPWVIIDICTIGLRC